jgi:hypothetical protein
MTASIFGSAKQDIGIDVLERAYEKARDELQKQHNLNHAALAELIDPLTGALLDLYEDGQRDEAKLRRYGVSKALSALDGATYH